MRTNGTDRRALRQIFAALSHRTRVQDEDPVEGALEELMRHGYRVLHDVPAGRCRLEHVVVGPTGVYAIETRPWTGDVWVAKGERLMRKAHDEVRTINRARAEAMEVEQWMAEVGIDTVVDPVVVLTRTCPRERKLRVGPVTVLSATDLVDHIENKDPALDPAEVSRAANGVMFACTYR